MTYAKLGDNGKAYLYASRAAGIEGASREYRELAASLGPTAAH